MCVRSCSHSSALLQAVHPSPLLSGEGLSIMPRLATSRGARPCEAVQAETGWIPFPAFAGHRLWAGMTVWGGRLASDVWHPKRLNFQSELSQSLANFGKQSAADRDAIDNPAEQQQHLAVLTLLQRRHMGDAGERIAMHAQEILRKLGLQ